ncbi:enoyl-CoA hydratase-related protein [Rhodococcus erythropolis]|uniref:enoyl-CoA hydratase-related protein n=1 Tax=Rhodococcus erythropolis TaxID=1833 RepID=UPI0037AF9D89
MRAVERTQNGAVLNLSINRADKRNAVDHHVLKEMSSALAYLETNADLRVGVLTGSGGHFCAGADLADRVAGNAIIDANGLAGLTRLSRTKPLICAVEGYALGGGFEIALACDIIVASETARFGLPEVKRAVLAAEGGLHRTTTALGKSMAMYLALSGRTIDAARLFELGLVCELTPVGEATNVATRLALEIAGHAPESVLETRALIEAAATVADELLWEKTESAYSRVRRSPNYRVGARAFLAKEPPQWR